MNCGVGLKRGSDPELLWLWCRLAAVAPIRPLAWEQPYVAGTALEKTKKKIKIIIFDRWPPIFNWKVSVNSPHGISSFHVPEFFSLIFI